MKKQVVVCIAIMALLVLACAPKVAPTPTPTFPIAPSTVPVTPTPMPIRISPEEAAWQKTVEAAQKEGTATFYANTVVGEAAIQVRKAFKDRYNVSLDIIGARGAEVTERLKTERRMGNMVGDLVQSSSAHVSNMKNLNLLDTTLILPSLRNKNDFRVDPLLDKEGYMFIYYLQTIGPMVNTKLISPNEEPRSWQDMLNPKWRGKMMASSPLISGGMYQTFIPLLNAKVINLEWLRNIGKQDLVLTQGDQETAGKLSRGDYPIALQVADSFVASYTKEGAPIKVIAMAEGYTAISSVIALVKDSPHPNASRLFLNWILSTEGQTVYHKSKNTLTVRKDVPDFRPQALVLPPTTKIVVESLSDAEEEGKKFSDKWLIDLWKK